MKNFILGCLLLLFSFFIGNEAYAIVSVKGYYRSNGTYVAPHYRSDPDGIKSNNFSYPGNYNPNTGSITGGTPSYSAPSYSVPVTPTCPSMASYDSLSGGCKCLYGYVVGVDILGKQACVSGNSKCTNDYGYGAEYDSLSNKCKCRYGYIMSGSKCISETSYCSDVIGLGLMSRYNSLSGQCECMSGYEYNGSSCVFKSTKYYYNSNSETNSDGCPLNSHTSLSDSKKCTCDDGYEVNSTKDSCVKTSCPLNSVDFDSKCVCLEGYIMKNNKCITHTDNCIISFGLNVYGVKNINGDDATSSCYCNTGYDWDSTRTNCVIKKVSCPNQAVEVDGNCYCDAGYIFNADKTQCIKKVVKISYATTVDVVNIREKPTTSSKVIGKVNKNIKYEIIDLTNKDWVKIKFANKTGWVSKKLVTIK